MGTSYIFQVNFSNSVIVQVVGTPRDVIEGKKGHFHLMAWSVPLVLTVVCLALKEVCSYCVSIFPPSWYMYIIYPHDHFASIRMYFMAWLTLLLDDHKMGNA